MSAIYHENSLIKTKLQIPDCGSNPVKRKRLLDWLNQNENCKIITVTAPAGYGKTFLISSFAAGRVKRQRVAWFTAEEEDNEEELFWSYFLYSFYGSEWAPEEIKQKAEAGLDHTMSLIRLQLTHFINDITELGTRITMIIDNLEVITNQKILEQLAFFIRHLPANAHMILSGRETPDIGLTKYKAAGEVLTLTYKELAFTQEETIAFFRHGAHIRLSQEEYAKISHVLEGWAAGMQLAVTMIDQCKSEAALTITENRLIHSYFREEVMERVDDTTRSFLVRTSALEQFCPSLCDFVLQTENAAEVIQRLEKAGLFLIQAERPAGMCIDKKERWFRFHRLFREFLQTGMEGWEENQILSLYRQASEWFERKKYWKEAIHYAIWGREFEKAAGLLEKLSGQIGCRGEAGLLHKWNRYLPAEKEIRELLGMLADQEEETLPVAGLLYAQLAEINYQRNELAEALNLAMEGAGYGELGGDVWTAGENYLILEKIYLAGNDRKQYECVKEKVLQLLEGRNFFDLGIKLECCHIQALLSVVYEKMGERGRALNELEQALSLAQEQGNYQFFLNKGEWMEGLLKRLERKGSPGITETVFWEGLLGCFEARPENGRTSGEILSKREMEILNMVAQGAGNGEIADKLFVSRNTVKTHLLNIYTKLGVHSRTKAVSKAEALKLISLSG